MSKEISVYLKIGNEWKSITIEEYRKLEKNKDNIKLIPVQRKTNSSNK